MKDRNKTSITTNDLPIKEILEHTLHTHQFNTNSPPPKPNRHQYTLPLSPHLSHCPWHKGKSWGKNDEEKKQVTGDWHQFI